ncbi:hypothetical protein CRG98_029215 [Punica granatum]|uniref:Uncharacterized protein n=1 Tax=Punica granatum TaxID=22663 RepID=A0A2I0J2C5_PUNGR|nr:hypothetical protein CRG98_029215 [Punica granatum]
MEEGWGEISLKRKEEGNGATEHAIMTSKTLPGRFRKIKRLLAITEVTHQKSRRRDYLMVKGYVLYTSYGVDLWARMRCIDIAVHDSCACV